MPAAMPGLVAALLEQEGLQEYAPKFVEQGVDDLETLFALKDQDYSELGMKIGHKRKLLLAVTKYKESGAKSVKAVQKKAHDAALEKVRVL